MFAVSEASPVVMEVKTRPNAAAGSRTCGGGESAALPLELYDVGYLSALKVKDLMHFESGRA